MGLNRGFTVSSVFDCPHVQVKTAFSGKFHSGERFRKAPFSLIVFVGYVWMEVVSIKKHSRFQMKKDTCGQDLNKQNNNARTSNIFVHFSDVPAGM